MKLAELTTYFERLDEMTSRNAMISELADLFRASSDPAEIREIVYLSEGIMLPAYEAIEIGISEQFMGRAIAEATGDDIEKVRDLYRDLGDYGLVAERLIIWDGAGLTVTQAYESLLSIARISGKGSTESKISALAALVRKLSPEEARYLVRVPIGKLRLGIGDPTIMDGLAKAYDGERNLRPVLERAYNLSGDMGCVAFILYKQGPERLVRFQVRSGTPIRVELAEHVPDVETILRRLGRCAVEPKYDGFRCQIHKNGDSVRIYTRNLENATDMFPELVQATKTQIRAKQAVFEGEAVSYDPDTGEFRPFQVTVQRKRKHMIAAKEEELPLRLMAFDCLFVDGEEVLDKPYLERRNKLREILEPGDRIQITDALITDSVDEVNAFLDTVVTEGLEGIMAKSLTSPYRAGRRTFDWIKLKRSYQSKIQDTVDCVIVGYFAGRGKRARWGIGSLLCAVYNKEKDEFDTITRVATGLSDQDWQKIKPMLDETRSPEKPARVNSLYRVDVWVEPAYVTEILADEITRSPNHTAGRDGGRTGYALRFPRIVQLVRADKKPEDATTVQEIKELYDIQRKSEVPKAA